MQIINLVLVPNMNLPANSTAPAPTPLPPMVGPYGPFISPLDALSQIPLCGKLLALLQGTGVAFDLWTKLSDANGNYTLFAFVDSALPAALGQLNVTEAAFTASPLTPVGIGSRLKEAEATGRQVGNARFSPPYLPQGILFYHLFGGAMNPAALVKAASVSSLSNLNMAKVQLA